MKQFRAYRFPPLAQFTSMAQQRAAANGNASGGDAGAQWAASVTEGFEQGQRDGYEIGLARGQEDGYEAATKPWWPTTRWRAPSTPCSRV